MSLDSAHLSRRTAVQLAVTSQPPDDPPAFGPLSRAELPRFVVQLSRLRRLCRVAQAGGLPSIKNVCAVLTGIGGWLVGLAVGVAPRAAHGQDIWVLVGVGLPVAAQVELQVTGFALSDLDVKGGLVEARGRVASWLSVAPSVLLAHRSIVGGHTVERRERLDLTLHADAGRARLAWRTLLERRHYRIALDDEPSRRTSVTMLRGRIRADRPLGDRSARFTPFAAIEPFYDLSSGRAVRTLLTAGVSLNLGGIRLEPYYLRRLERDRPDGDAAVLSAVWRP